MKKEGLTFIIFGGTGDLAKRKLAPAFAQLIHDKILRKESTLIGIGRKNYNDESYKKFLMQSIEGKQEKKHFSEIKIKYLKIDFSKIDNILKLKKELPYCEAYGCNRIFYLATSFKLFPIIVQGLRKCQLLSKKDKFNRIVFEKPFGTDLKSSDKLNKNICKVVNEKHIYRIDHYLGKESVQNIAALKFSNPRFSKIMNNKHIESIELIIDEKLGVENRMEYYNEAGAIKDMIQNHLLQMLSLLLMDKPKKNDSKSIHNEKIKVLKKLIVLKPKEHLIGQYKSYLKEARKFGIKKSRTETFAKIFFKCTENKWKGIKISLRTGKKLPKKYGQININFKNKDSKMIIHLQPKQDIKVNLFGEKIKNIDFCPECIFRPNSTDAYVVLLQDIIRNDRTLFVSDKEIHEAWKLVDKIEKMKPKIKFVIYKDCTDPEKIKA